MSIEHDAENNDGIKDEISFSLSAFIGRNTKDFD